MKPQFRYTVQYQSKSGKIRRASIAANNENGAWLRFQEMRPSVARHKVDIFLNGKNV